ncbi:DUF58 domain-containing protein [Christiangramia salexigens]|uniref:Cell division protein FtsB n=1 Tax=Christiangramia salexigens TaxID=1913577 RepID=A0A1L3J3S0_9FLAO|nr:DUF58 domain-containing protein [Christiangramia salexigens]APG59785.1 cell division protein FtsB [Christiangramia salexigens]
MIDFIKSLYFGKRFFYAFFAIALIFLCSFWFGILYSIGWILLVLLVFISILDIISLFKHSSLKAHRELPEKFSNSDENQVILKLRNKYSFTVHAEIIDEIPVQFQKRDFLLSLVLPANSEKQTKYILKPLMRGEYTFGNLNIYISSPLKLAKRRYIFNKDQIVKVYPSFIQMKKLDFLALDQKISLQGIKRIRRIGHTMEFEQIKEYVPGDDVRTINWKASAKQNEFMVNQFQDEKAQPVYSVIDCGRLMKMPFEGLSLLDYAINSSLAISNVALKKKDRVGLLAFSKEIHAIQKAGSKLSQLNKIMEAMYNIDTGFYDSDYSLLYSRIRKNLPQRSLLLLYTNFEHMSALKRQLPYLKALSRKHLLVVIFFRNTEILKLTGLNPETIGENAEQTIAEQFIHDKNLMLKELLRHNIQSILTTPKELSVNTINKYLEIKSRGLI